jgi:aldehyde dehydrogenase (NAD+)
LLVLILDEKKLLLSGMTLPKAEAQVELGGLAEQLRTQFRNGVTRSHSWRIKQLHALRQAIVEREQAILEALAADLGKSAAESQLTELQPALQEIALALKGLPLWASPRVIEPVVTPWYLTPAFWLRRVWRALLPRALGGLQPVASYGGATIATTLEKRYVLPEPRGVALIITAWNYPLLLPVWHMTSAIAAGNCMVVKPSEVAPVTAKLLAGLVQTYMDTACIRVVLGDASTTQQLLQLETDSPVELSYRDWTRVRAWDIVHFTGGWRVGRCIATACAQQLIPCVLELGGKNPLIIDVKSLGKQGLSRAARMAAWAKLLNAGQTCIAPDYVLLVGASADQVSDFVEQLRLSVESFYGVPVDESVYYPRIVNATHTRRLANLLKETKGSILFGGACNESDRFLHPTIVCDVAMDDVLMAEEIFGPIMPILQPCTDVDCALRIVQTLPSPLVIYLLSRETMIIRRFERETSSGTLVVNDLLSQVISPGLPFGGVATSGLDKSKGQAGFDAFSHLKSVLQKPLWIEAMTTDRYHPLSDRKVQRLRALVSLPK